MSDGGGSDNGEDLEDSDGELTPPIERRGTPVDESR